MRLMTEDEVTLECAALWTLMGRYNTSRSNYVIIVNPEFLQNLKYHCHPFNSYGLVQEGDKYFMSGCEVIVSPILLNWRLLVNPEALPRYEDIQC